MSGNCSEDDIQKDTKDIGNWEKDLEIFYKTMRNKIIRQIWKKGYPTKDRLFNTSDDYLVKKLQEHLELGHYSDVANFAFMLYQKNGDT